MGLSPPIRAHLRLNGLTLLAAVAISLALAPPALAFCVLWGEITTHAGPGGMIQPTGGLGPCGACETFFIIPDPGYETSDVLVNGISVGPVSSFVLCYPDFWEQQSIEAEFFAVFPTIAPALELILDVE